MEIWVYEMYYDGAQSMASDAGCIPLSEVYIGEYKRLYNEAYYSMRKALDIKPYNWFGDDRTAPERTSDIFLLVQNGHIIGSVACYENEIDDLFVAAPMRGRGIGRALVLWAIGHIREQNDRPVTLRVAEWNSAAVGLYKSLGFKVNKRERVR